MRLPRFAVLAVALQLLSGCGVAQEADLSAPEALTRAETGTLLLVDVRHPREWRETGLPAPAEPLSIHDPGGMPAFERKLRALAGPPGAAPALAFVCASGARSSVAAQVARDMGYTRVYNVGEGMLGSQAGRGWLARDLPTEPCAVC